MYKWRKLTMQSTNNILDEIVNCDIEKVRKENEEFHAKGILEGKRRNIEMRYKWFYNDSTLPYLTNYLNKSNKSQIERIKSINNGEKKKLFDKLHKLFLKMINIKEDFN